MVVPSAVIQPPATGYVHLSLWGTHISVHPMAIVLVLVLSTVAYIAWRGQRQAGQNTFDVYDLVMDTLPDGTRRASGIKVSYQVAFITSTWVIVDNELKGSLSEGIFGLYLGTWAASLIAKVIFDKPDPPRFFEGGDRK